MESDIKGISQCEIGEENYETFSNYIRKQRKEITLYQYDYRTPLGELFSCVAPSLEKCREKKDNWLEKNFN